MAHHPDLLTVAEVRKMLGRRYESVCAGGRCCPLDVDGRRMYDRTLVERGLRRLDEPSADESAGLTDDALAKLSAAMADALMRLEAEVRAFVNTFHQLRARG